MSVCVFMAEERIIRQSKILNAISVSESTSTREFKMSRLENNILRMDFTTDVRINLQRLRQCLVLVANLGVFC